MSGFFDQDTLQKLMAVVSTALKVSPEIATYDAHSSDLQQGLKYSAESSSGIEDFGYCYDMDEMNIG